MTDISDHTLRKWGIWLQSALVLSFSFYAGVNYQRLHNVEQQNAEVAAQVNSHEKKISEFDWQIRQLINTQARQTRILESLVKGGNNG